MTPMTLFTSTKPTLEITGEAANSQVTDLPGSATDADPLESGSESHRRLPEDVNLQEDLKWFLTNLQAISDELGEQWVAVRGKQVIAHGDTVKAVREEMQRLGVNRAVLTRSGLSSWDLIR